MSRTHAKGIALIIVLILLAYLWLKYKSTTMNLVTLARNAGFQGYDAIIAAAVALAESSGNPKKYNPESDYFQRHGIDPSVAEGQGSVGLWQIFQYVHPEFRGQDLYDPQTNANAAYKVYKAAGYSFSPWSTFSQNNPKTGEPWYTAYLNNAEAQSATPTGRQA